MTRVWIAQCLCPGRHCILAAANEADSETQAREELVTELREAVDDALRSGTFNAWCGLCGAGAQTWRYEVGRTPFATIEEATPALRQTEQAQTVTRELWGDMRRND